MPSLSHRDLTHLGMDVHKDSVSVAILRPDEEAPDVERIFNDEPSVRRFLTRFDDPRKLSTCYEAGPTGYELHRLVRSMGVACQVNAPSLIPKSPGDRVKTDKRDAASWPGYTAPASWSPSGCPPDRRRRCGTCAEPGPTWSRTSTVAASAWERFYCATAKCGEVARRGL